MGKGGKRRKRRRQHRRSGASHEKNAVNKKYPRCAARSITKGFFLLSAAPKVVGMEKSLVFSMEECNAIIDV
jgi:hypothetical protein